MLEALEPEEAEAVRGACRAAPHAPPSSPRWPSCRSCSTSPRRSRTRPSRSRPAPRRGTARPRRPPRRDRPLPRPKRRRLPRIEWTRPRVAIASALIAAVVAVTATAMVTRYTQPASSRRYVLALHAGAGAAPKAEGRDRALPRARRHRRAPVGEGLAAGLQAGLRDALRQREVDDERGHLPRRRPRPGGTCASRRRHGSGNTTASASSLRSETETMSDVLTGRLF